MLEKFLPIDFLTASKFKNFLKKESFSNYLPYSVYDDENQIYEMHDETKGFLLECSPLIYADDKIFEKLQNIFSNDLPQNTIVQFILYSDANLKNYLTEFEQNKIVLYEVPFETFNKTKDFFVFFLERIKQTKHIDTKSLYNKVFAYFDSFSKIVEKKRTKELLDFFIKNSKHIFEICSEFIKKNNHHNTFNEDEIKEIEKALTYFYDRWDFANLIYLYIDNIKKFITKGTKGTRNTPNIPFRNYRLFVTIKLPNTDEKYSLRDIKNGIIDTLNSCYLYPQQISPQILLEFLSDILNAEEQKVSYNPQKPLNKQIINGSTRITKKYDKIVLEDIGTKKTKTFKAISMKEMSKTVSPFFNNTLLGGIFGQKDDNNQIPVHYLYCVSYIFNPKKTKKILLTKATITEGMGKRGGFSPLLAKKKKEFMQTRDNLETTAYLQTIPILFLWDENEEKLSSAIAKTKGIWSSKNVVPQTDGGILDILFISSLPFGLPQDNQVINTLERDFSAPIDSSILLAPIQIDVSSGLESDSLFIGRKGNIIPFSIFNQITTSFGGSVVAQTGKGKSFFTNYILLNEYLKRYKVRVIDIGRSYEKLCNICKGRNLIFSENSNIIINPFTNIVKFDNDFVSLKQILAQMIYSSSQNETIKEAENTMLGMVLSKSWKSYGNDAEIDTVYDYLLNPTNYMPKQFSSEEFLDQSKKMAFNLYPFTSKGQYGKWFNGKSNLNINDSDFVVLELEELKEQKELFKIVTSLLLNYITSNLYLSKVIEKKTIIFFDEAWQFFQEKDASNLFIANVIEEGYRKARKYGGSFWIITQSLLDFQKFGTSGTGILGNSAYLFCLASPDFAKARQEQLIDCDDFALDILQSVDTKKPLYSEIHLKSSFSEGVFRLILNPYSYFLFTTDPDDKKAIYNLQNQNFSLSESILILTAIRDKQTSLRFSDIVNNNFDILEAQKIILRTS